jgi:hypothetical protein
MILPIVVPLIYFTAGFVMEHFLFDYETLPRNVFAYLY